jgi:hypothetical protein
VLADSSVAVLALPAIYRELEVDLGDLHWVLTTSNLVLALVRLRPRGSRAQHWRNHWRSTRRLPLKVRRLQQFSQRCTPLPKPRAHVRFKPGHFTTPSRSWMGATCSGLPPPRRTSFAHDRPAAARTRPGPGLSRRNAVEPVDRRQRLTARMAPASQPLRGSPFGNA